MKPISYLQTPDSSPVSTRLLRTTPINGGKDDELPNCKQRHTKKEIKKGNHCLAVQYSPVVAFFPFVFMREIGCGKGYLSEGNPLSNDIVAFGSRCRGCFFHRTPHAFPCEEGP